MTSLLGFLAVDKGPGVTSHDVVAMVRAFTGLEKVGHTGTLDPFATGVLPLALGPATRLIRFLDESEKGYDATIQLGVAMDTGDPTGQVIGESPIPPFDQARVLEVLASFLGDRMQVPPKYSAVKVAGRRLYEYARAGEEVEAQARPIHIFGLELLEMGPDMLRVMLRCSRGTYARGLADEIALALGTVGHLRALSRVKSGPFLLERSLSMSALSEIVSGDPDWMRALQPRRGEGRVPWRPRSEVLAALQPYVVPLDEALAHLPKLEVAAGVAAAVRRGGRIPAAPIGLRPGDTWKVVEAGRLVALAQVAGGGQNETLWRDGPDPTNG